MAEATFVNAKSTEVKFAKTKFVEAEIAIENMCANLLVMVLLGSSSFV